MATIVTDRTKANPRLDVDCPKCWVPLSASGDEIDGRLVATCPKCKHIYVLNAAGEPVEPTPDQDKAIHVFSTSLAKKLVPILDGESSENVLASLGTLAALYISENFEGPLRQTAIIKAVMQNIVELVAFGVKAARASGDKGKFRKMLLSDGTLSGDTSVGGGDGGVDAVDQPKEPG